jgi:hypothetical protein
MAFPGCGILNLSRRSTLRPCTWNICIYIYQYINIISAPRPAEERWGKGQRVASRTSSQKTVAMNFHFSCPDCWQDVHIQCVDLNLRFPTTK